MPGGHKRNLLLDRISPLRHLLNKQFQQIIFFGRQFDLGEFAWIAERDPACDTYASWEITGPTGEINRANKLPYNGWEGTNATGWWHPDYDAACRSARSGCTRCMTVAC